MHLSWMNNVEEVNNFTNTYMTADGPTGHRGADFLFRNGSHERYT